ncbi:MAG: hypothetical protein KME19_01335 [Microcoleus vaginatus WJT46-NPBG5]|nr:hypothetical protein [Microcoleus vaginatus WJT46-NPBG5]
MNQTTGIAGIFSHPSSLQPDLLRNVNILGHWALGIGNRALGIGNWALGISFFLPLAPCPNP